jgi:hypothetical protein
LDNTAPVLGELMEEHLGASPEALTVFDGLAGSFTGTVAELFASVTSIIQEPQT